jgi:hypothetical protein
MRSYLSILSIKSAVKWAASCKAIYERTDAYQQIALYLAQNPNDVGSHSVNASAVAFRHPAWCASPNRWATIGSFLQEDAALRSPARHKEKAFGLGFSQSGVSGCGDVS